MQQYRQVADVQTAEMLKLPVPKLEQGRPVTVTLSTGAVELAAEEIEIRVTAREGFAVSREGTEAVALLPTALE